MNAATRLGLYGLGVVVAFGGAFGIAGAVVPDSAIAGWTQDSEMNGHASRNAESSPEAINTVNGLALGANGYVLSPVKAPTGVGQSGTMSFQIQDAAGTAVTRYTTAHEKDLHLIVTRSDGSEFRHVHPELDQATGIWSTPWEWRQAGSYRVFADFAPAGSEALTLTRTLSVAGDFNPVSPQPARVDQMDGFTVSVDGELVAGTPNELTISVNRDGEPVTTVEPYLGAFGHLVALREGDLAYVHAHAEGQEPRAGDTAGPDIGFTAQVPTAGSYLLYLDLQVDGQVHTAKFVLDAAHAGATDSQSESHTEGH
ncbi:heavy-metal-associated domain-containing protein [Paeniglutamicibacter gangotriensis]|uniref:Heavy-metal-associated domain-containing protein n=1 Tax=Paeniglutamicibacter gangotriensis TaxID=254787 RepID=A0A5B0E326_9MICC|nr:heavy-metal-associated domain-containing protein [Paeniglutamicibacter gangotriensis]KAA0973334.1 heavy-metal-associated domain-containing protein [Paeniglutamicibacter gangotriensis]